MYYTPRKDEKKLKQSWQNLVGLFWFFLINEIHLRCDPHNTVLY